MNVFINSGILVAIVYWTVFQAPFASTAVGITYDFVCHIFPPIIGVFEVMVTPIPVRIQHAVFTLIYLLLYVVNTVIYFYADPNTGAIYPILDYSNPTLSIITICSCAVAIFVLQLLIWVLYRCRMLIIQKTMSSTEAEHVEMTNVLDYDGDESHSNGQATDEDAENGVPKTPQET